MTVQRTQRVNGTSERILDIAERLVQTRGFNSFSYADISRELGITTAALHYHFRGKAELGLALITRYRTNFGDALGRIDVEVPDPLAKLEAYANLYAGVLAGDRLCVCGMLAAEYQTLPAPMRHAVIGFFDESQRWLTGVLTQGRKDGTLTYTGSPEAVAESILSTLEGAMLVARPYGDPKRFSSTVSHLLAGLATGR